LKLIHEVIITGTLKELLINLNFNYLPFFRHVVEIMKKEIDSLDLISEKLERLSWHLKWINLFQDAPESFNPKLKSITGMVSYWFEEINFYENNLHLQKFISLDLRNYETHNFKLQTDLSVSQFAFLLRIFIDSGLFKKS
jgi:hypothetical protein